MTRSTRVTKLALLYFGLATATLVWPIYPAVANRIEPRVFGLPFSLVWILGVITANFAVLVVLYRMRLIDAGEIENDESSPPTPAKSGEGLV